MQQESSRRGAAMALLYRFLSTVVVFLMLGLRSAVTEISGNTIFVESQVADQDLQVDLRRG